MQGLYGPYSDTLMVCVPVSKRLLFVHTVFLENEEGRVLR